jgi:uncharacterized protein
MGARDTAAGPQDMWQAEALVRRYYQLVDQGDIDGLLAVFSHDITYERQGTPRIVGKTALSRFYREDRRIRSGTHSLDQVLTGVTGWIAVKGTFRGELKTGEHVKVQFTDWHHVSNGEIDYRQSLFPGRPV